MDLKSTVNPYAAEPDMERIRAAAAALFEAREHLAAASQAEAIAHRAHGLARSDLADAQDAFARVTWEEYGLEAKPSEVEVRNALTVVGLWNDFAARHGLRIVTGARDRVDMIRLIINTEGMERYKTALYALEQLPQFLSGARGATLGWLMTPGTIAKVITEAELAKAATLVVPDLPEGMVSWPGGEHAPDDREPRGTVQFRNGWIYEGDPAMRWSHEPNDRDVVAYTPKAGE